MRPIFEKYSAPLYAGVILPRLGDAATAEDILRDTFCTALEKINSYRWQGHGMYGWLRQIAANKIIDLHRRSQRTGRVLADLAAESPQQSEPDEAADELMIAAQERASNARRVEEVLGQISTRYREAIQLRLSEELPREECARRMNVTVGNFDVILFRAVRAFRSKFDQGAGE